MNASTSKATTPPPSAPPMTATNNTARPEPAALGDSSNETGGEMETVAAEEAPCLSVKTACLGPVVPTLEPLKADLESDDSSIEGEDSDHDEGDDDFYFSDVMEMDTDQYFQRSGGDLAANHGSASRRTSCPSLSAASCSGSTASHTSAGSNASSLPSDMMDTSSGGDIPTSIRGFHSYSTGT